MKAALRNIWTEEDGVLSFEWTLLLTLLVIGIVSGVAAARDGIIDELGDVAQSAAVDQSYDQLPAGRGRARGGRHIVVGQLVHGRVGLHRLRSGHYAGRPECWPDRRYRFLVVTVGWLDGWTRAHREKAPV